MNATEGGGSGRGAWEVLCYIPTKASEMNLLLAYKGREGCTDDNMLNLLNVLTSTPALSDPYRTEEIIARVAIIVKIQSKYVEY